MSQPVPPPDLLNPDGSPKYTVSQRRSQIDEKRFVDIRHLVYMVYKKPDQTPLMQYEETLGINRDIPKLAVINYELNAGWLIRDGTENQGLPVSQPQPAVQGVPQMSNAPFNPPPNGAPQMQPPPMQQFQGPPQQQYQQPPQQQQFAPPQQQFQGPPQQQMMAPPVASPQQAAQPQQQEAPAAAPSGRKRKGAAVAPPPPPPPAQPGQPQQQQFAQPQFQAPQQQQVPVQQFQAPVPQGFQPPAQPQFQAPPQQQQQAPAPQAQTASVDLTPVLQRLDAIGKICEAQAKEIVESKLLSLKLLAVLHHMYLVNPSLQPAQGAPTIPRTLPEFQAFLTQFTGTP